MILSEYIRKNIKALIFDSSKENNYFTIPGFYVNFGGQSMITDVRLLDFVKDYEYEEFHKMVIKSNKGQTDSSRVRKVTEPISLRQMKNESKNRKVDCTPIDLSD